MKRIAGLALLGIISGCTLFLPMENVLDTLHGMPVSKVEARLGPPKSRNYLKPLSAEREGDPLRGASLWVWESEPYRSSTRIEKKTEGVLETPQGKTPFSITTYDYVSGPTTRCTVYLNVNADGIIYGSRFETDNRDSCDMMKASMPFF